MNERVMQLPVPLEGRVAGHRPAGWEIAVVGELPICLLAGNDVARCRCDPSRPVASATPPSA